MKAAGAFAFLLLFTTACGRTTRVKLSSMVGGPECTLKPQVQKRSSLGKVVDQHLAAVLPAKPEEVEAVRRSRHPRQAQEPESKPRENQWWVFSNVNPGKIPVSWDWRHVVTPGEDQGPNTGGCWAYAAAALVEAMYAIENEQSINVSESELLNCFGKGTCRGESPARALEYAKTHGLSTVESYNPSMPCPPVGNVAVQTLFVLSGGERSIARYIAEVGPVIMNVYFFEWFSFMPWIRFIPGTRECSEEPPNHAVLAVGFGEENGKKYWILKNSWGPNWGENGFVKLERGVNACHCETGAIGVSVRFRYNKETGKMYDTLDPP